MLIVKSTHPLPSLVVEGACHVDGASHVLDGEGAAYVPARDLVSNTRRWNRKANVSDFVYASVNAMELMALEVRKFQFDFQCVDESMRRP